MQQLQNWYLQFNVKPLLKTRLTQESMVVLVLKANSQLSILYPGPEKTPGAITEESGVDYCGPVFQCMVLKTVCTETKAVHLEFVTTLTTDKNAHS